VHLTKLNCLIRKPLSPLATWPSAIIQISNTHIFVLFFLFILTAVLNLRVLPPSVSNRTMPRVPIEMSLQQLQSRSSPSLILLGNFRAFFPSSQATCMSSPALNPSHQKKSSARSDNDCKCKPFFGTGTNIPVYLHSMSLLPDVHFHQATMG
jgi:hypothetical protein